MTVIYFFKLVIHVKFRAIGGMSIDVCMPLLCEDISGNPVQYSRREQFSNLRFKDKGSHEFSGFHFECLVAGDIDITDRGFVHILANSFVVIRFVLCGVIGFANQFHLVFQCFIVPAGFPDSFGHFFLQLCHVGYVQQAEITLFKAIPEQRRIP